MKKAAIVAATEFGNVVRTRSFLIGILVLPLMMVASVVVQILAGRADTKPRAFAAPSYGLVDSVAFSPDGKRGVSAGCWGRGVYLWDVASGREVSPFPRHHGEVTAVSFTPDGKHLATGSRDCTVALWEARTGRLVRRFPGHRGPVDAVASGHEAALDQRSEHGHAESAGEVVVAGASEV